MCYVFFQFWVKLIFFYFAITITGDELHRALQTAEELFYLLSFGSPNDNEENNDDCIDVR